MAVKPQPPCEPGGSYVRGSESEVLVSDTIGQVFDTTCKRHPDHLALIVRHQGVRWTYRELKARVDALACSLHALGLVPGDRIGVWAPNCSEWIVTQYATAKLGLILVSINPAYRVFEVEHALNAVGCRALVTASSLKTSDYLGMLSELKPSLRFGTPGEDDRLPSLEFVIKLGPGTHPGCTRFDDLVSAGLDGDRAQLEVQARKFRSDDAINIQFTSGTTGSPKGATLSHRGILNNGRFVGQYIGLSDRDILCAPVPLYHCFGMVMANLACLTHAACVVYPAETFEPSATLKAVAAERCTALYGVPTMFIAMLSHPDFALHDLSTLRTGIMAGAPCPKEIMRQVVERMNMSEVTIAYGMTETSPVSFQSRTHDPLETRVTSVGRIHPHLEAKIVDAKGQALPLNAPGELCTRGYSVMLGYWGDEARTAAVIDSEGWLHTGDLATLDAEGLCRIVGRIKDRVIRGGENISPREVEDFFHTHDDVQDVQVVGVPDPVYGEELCAWVVQRPGAMLTPENLRDFLRGKISHFKVPRHIRIVECFPTTVTGKVQKFEIRREMIEELGLATLGSARAGL